ncbi:two-component sensor histidine kinase [Actinoplanes sp. NBRC 103695]|nr:two-component sensor histidine kinase [Actinoplanes sp. NBRC 103695]
MADDLGVSWFPVKVWFPLALNAVGLVLVGLDLARRSLDGAPVLLAVTAWVTWAAWAAATGTPERHARFRAGLYLLMLAGGAFVAGATDVVGMAPAIVALLVLFGNPAFPVRVAAAGLAVALVLAGVAPLVDPVPRSTLVSSVSILLIGALGGLSRRQGRAAEDRTRALLEERVAVEQERALVAAMSERSRIARDLHDVLAHSLGGLVVQLEAVDALLEAGQGAEAHKRVIAARGLALSGLDEAKQAVSALREPPDEDVGSVLADLVAAHRALGGVVAVRGPVDHGGLSAAGRTALRRAVQELLTNARRHAPGVPADLILDWGEETLTVAASTPAAAGPRSQAGGGNGLTGMRERVTEAGGTMTVRAGPPFEVVLRLPRGPR